MLFRSAISRVVGGSTGGKAALAVSAALFLMAWKIPFDDPALMHGWWTLLISIKFYPVVVLWLFFISRLWRSTPPPAAKKVTTPEFPQAKR